MFHELSPTLSATYMPAGNAPPTPPQNDALDDIYGSAPSSPILASHNPHLPSRTRAPAEEILSDLPSRQRALDTNAYREGLSNAKGQYVQEGFDEGYSLGANLGLLVGYILGALQGFTTALKKHDEARWKEAQGLWEDAQRELRIETLLGREWVDEEGIWKWKVEGKEDEVTFREVAGQHPAVRVWLAKVRDVAGKWGVDLEAVEKSREGDGDVEGRF